MLAPESRFVVNTPAVAAKVIEGEAIIMNLSTGMYYSMDGAGALLWEWIERGHSIGEISDGLAGRYETSISQVQADVERVLDQAIQEGLVDIAPAGSVDPGPTGAPAESRLRYQSPELIRYSDMAELLALDPPMPMPAAPWTPPEGRP
jgi:hypothetical protein